MRTCFIHIGTHKTGTTSIQMTLGDNTETLDISGYIYPRAGRSENSGGHHNIAFELFDRDRFKAEFGTIDELLSEMKSSSKNAIISSEEFLHAIHYERGAFQRFIDKIADSYQNIIIVIYLRRQTDFLKSNYFECLKNGLSMTFEDYVTGRLDSDLDEFPLDYARLIFQINQLTGIELVVRSYDAVRSRGLLSDFFGMLGISSDHLQFGVRLNVELPLSENFLSYYQNRLGRIATDAERQVIGALMEPISAENSPRIAEPTRATITRQFARSNKDIAALYGLGALAAEDPPAHLGVNWIVIDHIFSTELPDMVRSFANMQERLERTDKALTEAQAMAFDWFDRTRKLEERLERTDEALAEARAMAFDRFDKITRLEQQLQRSGGILVRILAGIAWAMRSMARRRVGAKPVDPAVS